MRKFTLFLMSLFLTVGAMAQTSINFADFDASKTYRIYNKAEDKGDAVWKAMSYNNNSKGCLKVYNAGDASLQWQFVTAGENQYKIYNVEAGKYLAAVGGNSGVSMVDEASAVVYNVEANADGTKVRFWHTDDNPRNYLWNDGNNNLFGWKADSHEWWCLEEVKVITEEEIAAAREAFNVAYATAAEIIEASGYVAAEDLPLQTTAENSPYFVWTNAAEPSEGPIAQLVDGKVEHNNFFHTQWSNPVPAGPHYIEVDLGENCDRAEFVIRYTTRINNNGALADFPDAIEILGSNEKNGDYTTIATFNENLPQSQGQYWESTVVENNGYRYLRFNVTAERTYWHMSEFDITIPAVLNLNEEFAELVDEIVALKEVLDNVADNANYGYNEYVDATNALTTAIAVIYAPHTLNVTAAGWATLYLDFNAAIPADVEAYTVTEIKNGYVTLTEVEGVLTANTGVLVNAAQGNYTFNYAAEATANVEGNLLEGTVAATEIGAEAYVLSIVDGNVGLYKAQMAGGVWLNNANKAYLPASATNGAASYSFRFGEGTTGIENVEVENASNVIYDLTGRQVNAVERGIYIINGKKVLVK